MTKYDFTEDVTCRKPRAIAINHYKFGSFKDMSIFRCIVKKCACTCILNLYNKAELFKKNSHKSNIKNKKLVKECKGILAKVSNNTNKTPIKSSVIYISNRMCLNNQVYQRTTY